MKMSSLRHYVMRHFERIKKCAQKQHVYTRGIKWKVES